MEVAQGRANIRLRYVPEAEAAKIRAPRLAELREKLIKILGEGKTEAEATSAATPRSARLRRFSPG
jgi:hypothetical protein